MSAAPELGYDFHDAVVVSASSGPRREATFIIDLYDPTELRVRLRFGAITNFEQVRTFIAALDPLAPEYVASVDIIEYAQHIPSTAKSLHFRVELDPGGAIEIHCGKVSVAAES